MSVRTRGPLNTRRRVALLAGIAVAGLAVSGGNAVFAASVAKTPQAGGTGSAGAAAPALVSPDAVVASICNGGVLKRSLVRFSNDPQTISGPAAVNLLSAPVTIVGPASGTDTVIVTVSAETQLRGNTDNALYDWIEGIATIDGVPITDTGASELALSGSSTYSSNAFQACVTVGPGKHLLRVQGAVKTNGTSVGETGWIDDLVVRADVLE